MTSDIRLVVFDLDDVLCRYDRARRLRILSAMSGRTPHEIELAIWGGGLEGAADAGAIDSKIYLELFSSYLGLSVSREGWAYARGAAMTPWPKALALVQAVKAHVPVAILSNNGFLFAEMLHILYPDLLPLFGERILVSAKYGLKKPDPEIYKRLLADPVLSDLSQGPESVLFTDDKPWNVSGAQKAGLKGHVFTGIEDLKRRFQDEGLPL